MSENWKLGDIVRLNSGGPPMKIVDIDEATGRIWTVREVVEEWPSAALTATAGGEAIFDEITDWAEKRLFAITGRTA